MADRAELMQRLRTRTQLGQEVLAEIDQALSANERSVVDVLLDVGFEQKEIERILDEAGGGVQVEGENTLFDEKAPQVTTIARIDEPSVKELIGRLLDITGRFEMQGELARGAMGRILAAWDLHLGRPVAIKVLKRTSPRDLDRVRFLEEAQVTGQLQHPNIMPVYELGRLGDDVCFVMRRIEGRSLKSIIAHLRRGDREYEKQYGRARLLSLFHQLCLTVGFAHSRGVVHRDLKPSNVMVGDFGEVLLLDWGLCKIVGTTTRSTRSVSERWRTAHGQIIGTPAYMAPEQAMGDIASVDQRTDVYGLGAILYHLMTLRPPYSGRTNKEIVKRVLRETVMNPQERAPELGIPDTLAAIIMRSLERDPAHRYPNARALADAIGEYQDRAAAGGSVLIEGSTVHPSPAEEHVVRGLAAVNRHQSLLEDAALVRDSMQTELADIAPGAEPTRRQRVWQQEGRLRQLEIDASDTFAQAVAALSRAVALDPDHAESRRVLCDLLLSRHERCLAHHDPAGAAYYRRLIAEYDDGRFGSMVDGTGELAVEVHPTGAEVFISRLKSVGHRVEVGPEQSIGPAPTRVPDLPSGAYRIAARVEGREPIATSSMVRAGTTTRTRLHMLLAGTIPEGYVHIPVGTFRFGTVEGPFALPAEQALPDYLIGRFPVTCAAYAEFLNALDGRNRDEATARAPRTFGGERPAWTRDSTGAFRLPTDHETGAWLPDAPVVGLRAEDAEAYCRWRSEVEGAIVRLPTEDEWEKAARGPEGRRYPWGDTWEPSFAICPETWAGAWPPRCGHREADRSLFGAGDFAGGVREWTGTEERSGTALRVVRGGSYLVGGNDTRPLWLRDLLPPGRGTPDIGFRVVRELPA
jgi:serine/threonine-protein kinase